MKRERISHNVILRLPRYLRYLEDLQKNGTVRISSGELGNLMGITASQIRQDFSCFGEFGQQGYGYNVEVLKKEIREILGSNDAQKVIIIGAGNLGRALLGNFSFRQNGFEPVGAFDVSEHIVGAALSEVEIYHIDQLEDICAEKLPDIAVLTMPGDVAGPIVDRLGKIGIKGLWNFTNVDLKIRDSHIAVGNVHFSDSLLTLSYYVKSMSERQEG